MTLSLVLAALGAAASSGAAPPEARAEELRRNAYAVQLSFRVADCIVDGGRRESIAMLQQAAGTAEEVDAFVAVRREYRRCYQLIGREDSQLTTPLRVARAQIAEALYRRDFGPGRRPRAAAMLPVFDPALQSSEKVEVRRSAVAFGFASCIATAQPGEAAALLITAPYSPEEQAVIDRLVPHFSRCLPQGSELQINYPIFRGFIAEALYRQQAGMVRGSLSEIIYRSRRAGTPTVAAAGLTEAYHG